MGDGYDWFRSTAETAVLHEVICHRGLGQTGSAVVDWNCGCGVILAWRRSWWLSSWMNSRWSVTGEPRKGRSRIGRGGSGLLHCLFAMCSQKQD